MAIVLEDNSNYNLMNVLYTLHAPKIYLIYAPFIAKTAVQIIKYVGNDYQALNHESLAEIFNLVCKSLSRFTFWSDRTWWRCVSISPISWLCWCSCLEKMKTSLKYTKYIFQ